MRDAVGTNPGRRSVEEVRRPLDDLAELWFQEAAHRAVLERREGEYEDHFQSLMAARYGDDYLKIRPAGSIGDRKQDGFLISSRTVFQSYAPRVMQNGRTATKIRTDFAGALKQ